MAEEIVQNWETINELVVELDLPDDATDICKVRNRINNIVMEDNKQATDGQSMRFTLLDGDGNTVVFPLRLISDTTFPPQSP